MEPRTNTTGYTDPSASWNREFVRMSKKRVSEKKYPKDTMYPNKDTMPLKIPAGEVITANIPEPSEWQATIANCKYVPSKGSEPNRFHRWMHKLAFGIVWSRI
jgi:hypothetical protein